MTDLDLAPLSQAEAERLTEGIRVALDRTARGMADLAARVSEAYQRRADLALGYSSWAEYSEAEFGEATAELAAPIRRELVGYLSAEGMSTRAIAPAVGVSPRTVAYDIEAGVQSLHTTESEPEQAGATLATPTDVIIAEQHHVDIKTGEIIDPEPNPEPEPRKVTGLDGKTYQRPATQETKPRRTPIIDLFRTQSINLDRCANQIRQLSNDNRWNKNKTEIATRYGNDLRLAIEALQEIYANLTESR